MPFLYVQQANGNSFEVSLDKSRTTIGRSSRNDVCISDPFASRLHAEVRCEAEHYFIHDMGSANGTFHNGKRVTGNLPLKVGDVVRIGETEMHLQETGATDTHNTNVLLSDVDLTSSTEATILGRSGGGRDNFVTSVISEMASLERSGDRTGLLKPSPSAAPEKKRDLLAVVGKVVETLLAERSLNETLKLILDLVFDAVTAERGYVFLLGPQRELVLTASRNAAKPSGAEVDEVKISRSICDRVIGECTSVLTSDAQQDPRFSLSNSIFLNRIRSIMAVPLALNEEVLGMIYVDNPYATNRFSQEDLGVITTIARVAAIKIDNVRLMESQLEKRRMDEELKVASEIQLTLHPKRQPRIDGYDIAGVSFPCREIGGDYYDFFQRRNGKWILAVGDVSGKGIGAALMMSSLHAALHAQAQTAESVREIVSEVNAYITENTPENKFLTLFCGELCPGSGELAYANAGHNPAILVKSDLRIIELEAGGLPVGITVDFPYTVKSAVLEPGDMLFIYSDGITESINEDDDLFGEERLIDVLKRHHKSSASQIRDRVDEAVSQFVGKAAPVDDMTMVIIKRLPVR